jgi:antitoxin component of MazEF toxin-antitoxin module
MTEINVEIKKWGNSFAVVIPIDIVQKENMKEHENLRLIVLKSGSQVLHETFGMGKGRLTKTGQQMKDEARRELYN